MKKASLVWNFNSKFLSLVIGSVFGILTVKILATYLGPKNFGEINSFTAFVAIFLPVISQGAQTYFMRQYKIHKCIEDSIEKFLNFTFISSLSIFILVITILWANKFNVFDIGVNIQIIYVLIMCLIENINVSWLYTANEQFLIPSIIGVINALLIFIIIFYFRKSLTVEIYIIATLVTNFLSNMILIVISGYGKGFLKEILKFNYIKIFQIVNKRYFFSCMLLGLSGLFNLIYLKSDIVMLKMYGYVLETGYYSAAYKIINIITTVRSALLMSLMPVFIRKYNSEDKKEFNEFIGNSIKIGSIIGVLITVNAALLSTEVIRILLSKEFYMAKGPLLILLIMCLVLFINMGISSTLIVMHKDKQFTLLTFISATLNIGLNFILIPKYNMYGTAITTLMAEVSVIIISVIFIRSDDKDINILGILKDVTLKILSIAACAYVVVYFLSKYLLIASVILTIVFTVTFMLGLYLMKVIDVGFVKDLRHLRKK